MTALVLHMEHGGGNNSSFTTHTSRPPARYLFGHVLRWLEERPEHGGANYKVVQMFEDMKKTSDTHG